MKKKTPLKCKDCGMEVPRKRLSKAGLCIRCAMIRVVDAQTQMRERKGPIYEKWKARLEVGVKAGFIRRTPRRK